MQWDDLHEGEGFRKTYGMIGESHQTQNRWDDLDMKGSWVTGEGQNDAHDVEIQNTLGKLHYSECGMLRNPKNKTRDICNRRDRSERSCDHDSGNYQAGISRLGDESPIGLEQTRLLQLQLQKGTQLIKQQQERTFRLPQKKNCANKHEAAPG